MYEQTKQTVWCWQLFEFDMLIPFYLFQLCLLQHMLPCLSLSISGEKHLNIVKLELPGY
jgi:hypothetical protein